MSRPLWSGAISFGLVTVPVRLHPATRRHAELSFRLLHKKDHAPIDYRRFCSEEGVEVPWEDIEKGYEYAKGQFVVVTDRDFEKARVPQTQMIEIRDFVPAAQIDAAFYESPYWVEPARTGRKAYALLRETLARTGRVGVGTFVMRQRERLAALRPAGDAIMLATLRFADQLRGSGDLDVPSDRASKKELALATRLVDTLAGDFEPGRYHDTYRETLRRAITQKAEGKELVTPRAERRPKVVSLVAALEKSLAGPRAARGGRPRRPAARPRRAAKAGAVRPGSVRARRVA
jgi:DNA end-binding protein Ku